MKRSIFILILIFRFCFVFSESPVTVQNDLPETIRDLFDMNQIYDEDDTEYLIASNVELFIYTSIGKENTFDTFIYLTEFQDCIGRYTHNIELKKDYNDMPYIELTMLENIEVVYKTWRKICLYKAKDSEYFNDLIRMKPTLTFILRKSEDSYLYIPTYYDRYVHRFKLTSPIYATHSGLKDIPVSTTSSRLGLDNWNYYINSPKDKITGEVNSSVIIYSFWGIGLP